MKKTTSIDLGLHSHVYTFARTLPTDMYPLRTLGKGSHKLENKCAKVVKLQMCFPLEKVF